MTLTLIGVDTGDTTGIFRARIDSWNGQVSCAIKFMELPPFDVENRVRLELLEGAGTHCVIALERFTITKKTASKGRGRAPISHAPTGVVGIVEQTAAAFGVRMVVQAKSDAGKMATNERLREWGWWQPGMGHANDAARHALYALSGINPVLFAQIVSGGIVVTSRETIRPEEETS